MKDDFEQMFELAPVSLWLEDCSRLRTLFDTWRADGLTDLRAHLTAHPERIAECSRQIQVVRVNRRTLELFGADDTAHLVANLHRVFRDAMMEPHIDELVSLWEGRLRFSSETVNYSLHGERLDLLINTSVLPGHEQGWSRVLVALENITERTRAERYARGLFEDSPVSLWVEDFSAVKHLIDGVRAQGIDDFPAFTRAHPGFAERCMQAVRVVDVNRRTLELFRAPDKATLLRHRDRVFGGEVHGSFTEQLIDLWNGRLFQHREVVNRRLDGELVDVLLQFSVLPGAEADWRLVQIALVDITAHKRAEAHLDYLSKHDVLTQLGNRACFEHELRKVAHDGPWPVTIIAIDLNRLKSVNDRSGHAAGDALLRRAGEVLTAVADAPASAARIGGDEFVLMLPGTDEHTGRQMIERLESLVEISNAHSAGAPLSLAMGSATAREGGDMALALREADERMLEVKREFHAASGMERRTTQRGTL